MANAVKHFCALLSLTAMCGCGAHVGVFGGPGRPNVILIGDSITFNWQPFDKPVFAANPQWTDAGVTGESSDSIAARFKDDVVILHPAIVQIIAGTNDVYPGWVLCQDSYVAKSIINSCTNITRMVTMAKAAGIKVILGTIPPWGPGRLPKGADPSPERYTRILQWNNWLKSYGAAQGVTVVDYHAALVSADGETYVPTLTVDGVHPSSAGFAVMTPLLTAAIAAQGAPAGK